MLAGRLPTPGSPVLGNAIEMLAGGAVLVVFAVVAGESPPAYPSAESLLAVAYLIGPGPLLAMTRYMIAPRRLPTGVVSTYAYVNPFVAVAFGALLLGERFTLSTVIGGAIVVASVALLLLSQRPREFTD